MKIDRLYILTVFLWLVAGMIFGIYLGITGSDGALAPPGSILVALGTLVTFWMFATMRAEIEVPKKRVT